MIYTGLRSKLNFNIPINHKNLKSYIFVIGETQLFPIADVKNSFL